MARYITETIPCQQKGVIIKMVFFNNGYNPYWLTTKTEHKRTIASTVMEQLALDWLREGKPLDATFVDDYIHICEKRMENSLAKDGKGVGAYERVHSRMTALYNALRAVLVADNLTGQLRVQCLNLDSQVAIYDPLTQTVSIEDDQWNVAADLLPVTPGGMTGGTSVGGMKKPEKPGGTTGGTSGGGTKKPEIPGGTTGGTSGVGGTKNPEKPSGTTGGTSGGGTKKPEKPSSKKGGPHVIVFGNKGMTVERETSGLSSRNPVVRWWKKYRFGVVAFVFFFVLSASIVYGLLRLQKSIEALPNAPRTEQPAAPADSISPADSLQARLKALDNLDSLDHLDHLDHLDNLDNLENLSPA